MKSLLTMTLAAGVALFGVDGAMAGDACGIDSARSCFRIRSTPGCSDAGCCTAVCSFDSFCCDVEWDSICRHNAVQLCSPPAPANDRVAGAEPIRAGLFEVCTIGATDGADNVLPKGCGGMFGNQIRRDVWYRFTATHDGIARLTSCPSAAADVFSEFDPIVIVCSEAGERIACNDERPDCGIYAELEWETRAGRSYLVQIGGHDAFVGFGRYLLEQEGVVPPPACPADLSRDGMVGAQDITILLSSWGMPGGDVTGDGMTNAQDITAMLSAWGACP